MKRSPMPRRRTPLRSSGGLAPGKPLARRTRLAPVSAKRRAAGSSMARPDEPLKAWCEVAIPGVCLGRAANRHHKLRRSKGGTDDRSNTLDLCGSGTTGCHGHVHANPAESYARGWLIRSAA